MGTDDEGLARGFRMARGVAVEATWVAVHLATYPLGIARERRTPHPDRYRLDTLAPTGRGLLVSNPEAAGTPIMLVHGIADNRTVFGPLRRGLRQHGFERLLSFSYEPVPRDLYGPAEQLVAAVEGMCAESGDTRVHLIGHSLGGLVARYAVQCLGLDRLVHTVVTLGAPHAGTRTAAVLPHPLLRQLRPESALMSELAGPADCGTRFVAIWSDLDQVILPHRNARLDHADLDARNVRVRGVGHLSLPINRQVIRAVCETLTDPERPGDAGTDSRRV